MAGGRPQAEVTHALYLPPGSSAAVGDRVVLNGRLFRITVTGLGPPGGHDKLLLRELRHGSE